VARDWNELFIAGEPGASPAGSARGAGEDAAQRRRGLFRRLRESMGKTRQALGSEIQATLFGVLDEQTWNGSRRR